MRHLFYVCGILLVVNGIFLNGLLAQRGGGGGGRGGGGGDRGGRGAGGQGDLRPSGRQTPFSDLPWGAEKLLEANRATFRKIPRPIQHYILESVNNWDYLFPFRQQQFETFFLKAQNADRANLSEAFQNAMPPELRNRQNNPGQWQGGGQNPFDVLSPEQFADIDQAFQNYVLPDQATTPGIVLIFLTGVTKQTTFSDALTRQGTLFTHITMPEPPGDALVVLQTGHQDGDDGTTLPAPSLCEFVNHILDDKTHHRTLAFFQSPDPPPTFSKTRGYGKKYAPLSLQIDQLSDTAKTIEKELSDAVRQGKSERYIEFMVKPKLTREALNIKKVVKEKALQHLVLQILLTDEPSRQLGVPFIQTLTNLTLTQALPDVLISQFDKDNTTPVFLSQLAKNLQALPRYQKGSTLAIVDHTAGQAMLLGPRIKPGQIIEDPHDLANLTATIARIAHLEIEDLQDDVIAQMITLP